MSTPLTKGSPIWLAKQDENDPNLNPNYRRSVRYYNALYRAWPDWCADDPRFAQIYAEAKRRRTAGEDVHVDHMVPIVNPIVSGLHVPWNLQVIPAKRNLKKSNWGWPGCPFQPIEMFDTEVAPHQMSLNL